MQLRDKWSFSSKDKIFFFKELSYMLQWWVSLIEAIKTLYTTSANYAVKDIAKSIDWYLRSGKPLSFAVQRLYEYFDQWDFAIIKSWETSWNLDIVLKSLADEYTYLSDIKNKYIGALLYPAILIVISIVAVFALFWFVLPSVFSLSDSFQGVELPLVTVVLKTISDFFVAHWKTLIWWMMWIWAFIAFFFTTTAGKKAQFMLLTSLPLVGKMTKYFYVVKWCRYMKLMLQSGMDYVQMFQLLKEIFTVPTYQSMTQRVLDWLEKWSTLYDVLQYETDILPNDVVVLIKVWETSANLEKAVDNVSNMYQSELDVLITRIVKVIEPIMLIGIGLIVVVIAMWVFGLILQIMWSAWV